MVVTDTEVLSEAESPLNSDQQSKNLPFSSLGRQSTIYSLTLDEFQHTLCETGKIGSMNMDQFLTSIWNAEENQVTATSSNNGDQANTNRENQSNFNGNFVGDKAISKQPSLPRQGSLSLPAPLCRKTVDEVWSEINQPWQCHGSSSNSVQNSESAPRQPTFGEMTLEDFLIKAGVVREHGSAPLPPQQLQFGVYQTNNNGNFVARPVLGIASDGSGGGGAVGYQAMAQQGGGGVGEPPGRNGGYASQAGVAAAAPSVAVYGGRVGNGGAGGGGYGGSAIGDGVVSDNGGNQFGLEMEGLRGRKRTIDGPVEKVVERRQRRMIKNRESAARSRARKQAYTVELEAELNQLKEENRQLRHALAEFERKRKQQYLDDLRMKAQQSKAQKAKDKLRMLRRNLSCPL